MHIDDADLAAVAEGRFAVCFEYRFNARREPREDSAKAPVASAAPHLFDGARHHFAGVLVVIREFALPKVEAVHALETQPDAAMAPIRVDSPATFSMGNRRVTILPLANRGGYRYGLGASGP